MNEWMDGWMNGWMDEWMVGWLNENGLKFSNAFVI